VLRRDDRTPPTPRIHAGSRLSPRLLAALAAAALAALAFGLAAATTAAEAQEFALTVNVEGEGEVECKVGSGVAEDCAEEYPEKTKLTLVPVAEEGSRFAGFSAGAGSAAACTGLKTSCTFTIEADSSVIASFNLKEFSLTVVRDKEGTGTGSWICEREEGPEPCLQKYPYGDYVYLTAEANPGSEFAGWSGCDAEPAPNECEVEMEESRKVTAKFEATEYTLGVELKGSGSGTVSSSPGGIGCGSVCSAWFPVGDVVALSAVSALGSEFAGWSGACSGTGACEVTMSEAKKVNAYFTVTATGSATKPPSPPPSASGIVRVAAVAPVSGRTAKLRLACSGGPCEGALKLTAKLKQGGKRQSLLAGKARFDLAAGASKALGVRIGRRIARLLQDRQHLMAVVRGAGVSARSVKLFKQASRKSKKATAPLAILAAPAGQRLVLAATRRIATGFGL